MKSYDNVKLNLLLLVNVFKKIQTKRQDCSVFTYSSLILSDVGIYKYSVISVANKINMVTSALIMVGVNKIQKKKNFLTAANQNVKWSRWSIYTTTNKFTQIPFKIR